MKSIKIFKAFSTYQTYLDLFYANNPNLTSCPFDKQIESLRNDNFPWILSWKPYNTDDRVDVFETIHNAYYLQTAWSNGLYAHEADWQKLILFEQIRCYQPDVCIIYPPELFCSDFINQVRSLVKKDILIGGYDGMNRMNISLYKNYDFVITCSSHICDYYKQHGMQTYPLYFGFEKNSLKQIHLSNPKCYEVGFSGSIFPNVHKERFVLLNYLAKHVPLVISSEFEKNRKFSIFSKQFIKSIARNDNSYMAMRRICRRNIGPLYGNEMLQFLRDSKVSINKHGDNINFAANVRLFEATGVGTCLLTDWKENIGDFFDPDKEVVTFASKEEAVDKIKFLLKHDDFRNNISLEGQKRTLSEYTYDKRIPKVIEHIKGLL